MNDIEKQILENELALALDAAEKGDKARLECGAMEMQIKNLKSEITRLESEAMYGAAAFQAAKDEISRLKDKCASLNIFLENLEEECKSLRKDAERYRWLTEDHDDRAKREARRELCERLPVMSYSAASTAVDAAMQENK